MGLKKLYLDNGYLNFDWVCSKGYPFVFMIGAKSIGKTYGALLYALKHHLKFIYLRRTQTQLDSIDSEEDSPFIKINKYEGYNVQPKKKKNHVIYYNARWNEETKTNDLYGEPIGYGLALSTFHNVSSIGFDGVDLLIYDEFIPMMHERKIKDESDVFFRLIDNITRNRELEGKKPMQVLCMANPNRLDNALFLDLGLTDIARKNKDEIYYNENMKLMLIQPMNSPISKAKAETSLFKLTKGTKFYNMAINNDFNVRETLIRSLNLKQYDLYLTIEELSIYKHKSDNIYYCCNYRMGSCSNNYSSSKKDIRSFRMNHRNILNAYLKNRMYFETFECLSMFEEYIKI